MLKIIHTGDIHLGAKFNSFGEKAGEQRRALCDVFKKIIDTAILERAQIVIISGDLFDSNFPAYQTVNLVKSELRKLDEAGICVAILPGTHDCLSSDSIYKRENFAEGLSRVYVFDDENVIAKKYPELDLAIYAQANTAGKSKKDPLAFLNQFETKDDAKYKIAIAHGSIQIEGKSADDDWPITLRSISESGMQYVALGHWHGAQDFSFGKTKAWYCGSPEITYQEGKGGLGQGYVLSVSIAEDAKINPVKISEKKIEEVSLDINSFPDVGAVYKEIEKMADKNTILILTLMGMANVYDAFDPFAIEKDFSDKFFSIKIKNKIVLKTDDINEKDYPEELMIGQFIRLMRDKISKSGSEEERKILEEALQLGVAELEGKQVI